jgi:hypothetical protein
MDKKKDIKPESDSEKEELKHSQANEPLIIYGDKNISFSGSFEESEEENLKWLASLSPEEHLCNAVKLIKRVYGITDDKKNKPSERKIYFD